MNRRLFVLAIVAIPLLTALTYTPALRNGFIWDDDDHLTENPVMTRPGGLEKVWTSVTFSRYYPLTLTSFWVQHRLWGLSPLPYHAVNILVHAANAVLVFLLLRRLNIAGAWVAAALWAVHPVNVESVAWITELKNTQSGLFFFATLLCVLRFECHGRRRWYALALICFAAALLSKPSTVVLPFVLLLLAWWQRGRLGKLDLTRAAPFFVLSAAMSLLTIVEQRGQVDRGTHDWSLTLTERLIVAGRALWFYAAKALWPFNLSFVYPRWATHPDSPVSLLPLVGVLAVVLILWRFRRQVWAHTASFGLSYYSIALLPVLGFFDIYFFRYSFVADHFQYLASLGIVTLIVAGGATLLPHIAAQRAVALVSVTGLSLLSWQHTQVFSDNETLWHDTLKKNADAVIAYSNLGGIANAKGKYLEAEQYFRTALRLQPRFLEARSNLGLALTEQHRYDEAQQELQEALRIKSDYSKALYCLARVYYKLGKLAMAEDHFHRAIISEPTLIEAYYDLGTMLLEQRRYDEAIKCFRVAIAARPNYVHAANNLGRALWENGQFDEAIQYYERAVRDAPDTMELRYNLALACRQLGRAEEAIRQLRAALKLKPSFAETYLELGRTLAFDRQYGEAIETFRHGLEIEPRHMVMGNEMAWLMATAPTAELRNIPQAIQIGERLAKLTARREPLPLDTLAAAYAEAGRFQEAVATACEAATLAETQGQTNLAAAISSRAALYGNAEVYRLDTHE